MEDLILGHGLTGLGDNTQTKMFFLSFLVQGKMKMILKGKQICTTLFTNHLNVKKIICYIIGQPYSTSGSTLVLSIFEYMENNLIFLKRKRPQYLE